MKHLTSVIAPVLVGLATIFIVFLSNGVLNVQTDTTVYLSQIHYYQGKAPMDDQARLRSFKPFYGVVGATFSHIMSEEAALLAINLLFYIGLIFVTRILLKELGFNDYFAAVGVAWVATGYPLLKYGLALLTDISGWFFAGLTITLFLSGIRKKNTLLIVAASVVAFIGSLCKETGLLGLLFAGTYLVLHMIVNWKKEYLTSLVKISLPFLLLETTFLFSLFQSSGSKTSFVDWFLFNKNTIGYGLHTWFYFFFTEASTFSLLWVFVAFGVFMVLTKKVKPTKEGLILGTSLCVATLPVLVWPVFLTRVLYIGYLCMIPFALWSLILFTQKYNLSKKTVYVISVLPVLASFALFFIASGGSLFALLDHF